MVIQAADRNLHTNRFMVIATIRTDSAKITQGFSVYKMETIIDVRMMILRHVHKTYDCGPFRITELKIVDLVDTTPRESARLVRIDLNED